MFIIKPVQTSVTTTGFLFSGASASAGTIQWWNGRSGGTDSLTLATGTGGNSSSTVMGQIAYLFGGHDGSASQNTVQRFTGSSRSTDAATLASAIQRPVSATITDAFIFGGRTGGTGASTISTIQRYTGSVRSTEYATLGTAVSWGGQGASLATTAYVFGGINTSNTFVSTIQAYDGSSASSVGAWLSNGARATAVAVMNGNAFLYGGDNGSIVFNTIQRFNGSTISVDSQTISTHPGAFPSSGSAFTLVNFMAIAMSGVGMQRYDGTTRSTDRQGLNVFGTTAVTLSSPSLS